MCGAAPMTTKNRPLLREDFSFGVAPGVARRALSPH